MCAAGVNGDLCARLPGVSSPPYPRPRPPPLGRPRLPRVGAAAARHGEGHLLSLQVTPTTNTAIVADFLMFPYRYNLQLRR